MMNRIYHSLVLWLSSFLVAAGSLALAAPIHDAAANGELDKVRELVGADPTLVGALDGEGKTALHHAAAKGHLEVVKFLVANHADVAARSRTRVTPIWLAHGFGHSEVEVFLVKQLSANSAVRGASNPGVARPGIPGSGAISPETVARPISVVPAPSPSETVHASPSATIPAPGPDAPKLFRVQKNGKVGYINAQGQVVVPINLLPLSRDFSEGLAAVAKPAGWEYIDEAGTAQIHLGSRYEEAGDFSDGMAQVSSRGQSGYIDKQGREVIKPQYQLAFDFSEGYASVQTRNGRSVFIDKEGKTAFPDYRPQIQTFSEGMAPVYRASGSGSLVPLTGFIDRAGTLVIPCEYTSGQACKEGVLIAPKAGQWFGLDTKGRVVLQGDFEQLRPFSEGLCQARMKGLWGFIDHQGKVVIEPKYESCVWFSEGLAGVKLNGKWGFIDKSGKMVVEPRFVLSPSAERSRRQAPQFRGGLALMVEGAKQGYINKAGEWVWQPTD